LRPVTFKYQASRFAVVWVPYKGQSRHKRRKTAQGPGTGGKGPPVRTRNNETGSRKAPPHPIVASVGTLQMR